MTILVLAEHDGSKLANAVYPVVSAAMQLGGDIHLLVAGDGVEAVAKEAATLTGISKVLHGDAPYYANILAENLAPLVAGIGKHYSHILAPASSFGKDALPRIAALLDMQQISDIIAIIDAETFVRPIYAGNALATVKSSDPIKLITVRPTSFDRAQTGGNAAIETLAPAAQSAVATFVSVEETKSDRPELGSARIVVSGGRALSSKEKFAVIYDLADKLHAAIGASRAAVDAGYIGNDYQVGQTGKVVAPELYIAVGISGAIQHLAGMKESKVIVAINKDENAPIFEIADYGLVGDLFELVPELTAKL